MRTTAKLFRMLGKFYLSLWLLLLFSFCGTNLVLADKNYYLESVNIDAQLNPDGSMDITEKRTYRFKGDFHWATYLLPIEKTGGVVDFSVSEEGKAYLRSQEENEGAYQYEESPKSISVFSYLMWKLCFTMPFFVVPRG